VKRPFYEVDSGVKGYFWILLFAKENVMKAHRVQARREGEIDVSADRAWALLMDWDGTLKWWDNSVPGDAMHIVSVHLEGARDAVPRTKVITRSNAVQSGLPLENRETLLLQDNEVMRCYYDADDGVVAGVRNYITTSYIDALSPYRCLITFASTFDVTEDRDPSEVRAVIESVYDGIFAGFRKYFAQQDIPNTRG